MRRDADDPAARLGDAAARYVDALYVAAEHRLGPAQVARLDAAADQIVPGLTGAPAWPTLRAHLLLLVAHGLDPVAAAAHRRHPTRAATPPATSPPSSTGAWTTPGCAAPAPAPCRGCPASPRPSPTTPTGAPTWPPAPPGCATCAARSPSRPPPPVELPAWARQGQGRPATDLLADVAVWRAATGVDPADRRPTGPTQIGKAANRWQTALTARLAGNRTPALTEWAHVFDRILDPPPP